MTMTFNKPHAAEGVSPSPRFLNMPPLPRSLAAIARPKTLRAGGTISQGNEEWKSCYYVLEGLVGSYTLGSRGNEYLTFLLGAQSLFLESDLVEDACLARMDLSTCFRALRDTKLLEIPQDSYRALMSKDATVANYVALSLAQKMHALRFLLYETRHHDALWQVGNLLLSFASRFGKSEKSRVRIDFELSQQLIADMLGMNRITVTKSIKKLRDRSLIEKVNDTYCVVSMGQLGAFLNSL